MFHFICKSWIFYGPSFLLICRLKAYCRYLWLTSEFPLFCDVFVLLMPDFYLRVDIPRVLPWTLDDITVWSAGCNGLFNCSRCSARHCCGWRCLPLSWQPPPRRQTRSAQRQTTWWVIDCASSTYTHSVDDRKKVRLKREDLLCPLANLLYWFTPPCSLAAHPHSFYNPVQSSSPLRSPHFDLTSSYIFSSSLLLVQPSDVLSTLLFHQLTLLPTSTTLSERVVLQSRPLPAGNTPNSNTWPTLISLHDERPLQIVLESWDHVVIFSNCVPVSR